MSNPHEVKTVKCANCGKVKQEANHWFVISTILGRFVSQPFETWGDLAVNDLPVCGQSCAQKELETWMTQTRNASTEAPGV